MSGGTSLALTADEIIMAFRTQCSGRWIRRLGDMPAASIVKLLRLKPTHQISDEMLVLTDVAQKARLQVAGSLYYIP